MTTHLLDPNIREDLERAVDCLRGGGLVAFPTETVYGLGADALNPEAVGRVFAVKGRPADNPLIVHVGDQKGVERFVSEMPQPAIALAEHFWPGPLTLVMERNDLVPDVVTAGLDTVAIRMPRHPAALALLKAFDGGIVGPSANISGRPSPTSAQHVLQDLSGKIEFVLEGGVTEYGLESTVIDVTTATPAMLRRGALTEEEIERVIGTIAVGTPELERRSPGMRHRHYAPRSRVSLIPRGDRGAMLAMLEQARRQSLRCGVLCHSIDVGESEQNVRVIAFATIQELARKLYASFRLFDDLGIDLIIAEECDEAGIGATLMDRLRRAAEPVKLP
ncbi:MAG: L-threonylcarbamoyladenylate synthase [Bacteroidetes bacterium]|nr:L-threonylcarbamoyladenylate synthase [Bacteroidota bacterium]